MNNGNDDVVNVCICGGGNSAHALAALLSSKPNVHLRILSLYANEAKDWSDKLGIDGVNVVTTQSEGDDKPVEVAKGRPDVVSNDPSECIPECDLILITVPSFAHTFYIKAIEPYVNKDTHFHIGAMASRCGFDIMVRGILGEKYKHIILFGFETLPWATRITEFGSAGHILGTKGNVNFTVNPPTDEAESSTRKLLSLIQINELPKWTRMPTFLHLTLQTTLFHPCIIYGQFKDWDGVTPLKEKPLFYQGVDEFMATLLMDMAMEIKALCVKLMKSYKIDFTNFRTPDQWLLNSYNESIKDKSNLVSMFRTNKAYQGLTHPMKQCDNGGFLPDFSARYLAEDLPFALVVIKGIAELAKHPTPRIDECLSWTQKRLGKEYIVCGTLSGANMKESRAPQVYNVKSLDDLMEPYV